MLTPLSDKITEHLQQSRAMEGQMFDLMRNSAIERARLEAELYRLRRMDQAVRTMAKADHAVAHLVRQLDAEK